MATKRIELKVGAFVLTGIVLLAAMLIMFSKGVTRFSRTYTLQLRTHNVGALRTGASVLMAGFPIGNVTAIELDPEGETVDLTLRVRSQYRIRTNCTFVIEQAGFLGDQYVAIYPSPDRSARYFEPGETATCPPPFNLQAVARDAAGFIQRIDQTAKDLNATIKDVRRYVLNEETLTNVALTVSTLKTTSEHALEAVENVQTLVNANRAPLAATLSNLVLFSEQARELTAKLDGTVDAAAPSMSNAVKNIESASAILESLLGDMQDGKGLAGAMLKDEQLAADVEAISRNLSITSSNINQSGLWRVLWGPKPKRTNQPSEGILRAPRDPFR